MGTVGTLIENLGDAAPHMCLVEDRLQRSDLPELNIRLTKSSQPLPAPGETELARYAFLGGIVSAVDPDSGRPRRQLGGGGPTRYSMLPIVSGGGLVVVTDQRILGKANGESQLSDNIDLRADGALFFSLPHNELESVSITQQKSLLGGIKERRVVIMADDLLGVIHMEIIASAPPPETDAYGSKIKTSRPFFDDLTQAAARYRWGLDQTQADRDQLQRVLAGQFEVDDDGDLVALFRFDDDASDHGPADAAPNASTHPGPMAPTAPLPAPPPPSFEAPYPPQVPATGRPATPAPPAVGSDQPPTEWWRGQTGG